MCADHPSFSTNNEKSNKEARVCQVFQQSSDEKSAEKMCSTRY